MQVACVAAMRIFLIRASVDPLYHKYAVSRFAFRPLAYVLASHVTFPEFGPTFASNHCIWNVAVQKIREKGGVIIGCLHLFEEQKARNFCAD